MTTNMLSPFAQATLDRAWDMKLPVDPFILVRSLDWSLYFSEDLNEGDSPFEVDEENTCVYLHPRQCHTSKKQYALMHRHTEI